MRTSVRQGQTISNEVRPADSPPTFFHGDGLDHFTVGERSRSAAHGAR